MKLFKKITDLFTKKEQMFVNKPEKIEEVINRELKVTEIDGVTNIYFGDDLIISNSEHKPFVEVLRGEYSIKDGKISSQYRKIIPIVPVKVEKFKNFIKMAFSDKGYRINVLVKQADNKLEISLDGKVNYELLNLNFCLSHDEQLYGLGDNQFCLNNKKVQGLPFFGYKKWFEVIKNVSAEYRGNISNLIYSNKNYLFNIDSTEIIEYNIGNKLTVSFNKKPFKIEYFFGKNKEECYSSFNEGNKNRQKLLARYIKGVIIEESSKKIEKMLIKAKTAGIEVSSILVNDIVVANDFTEIKKLKILADSNNVNLLVKVAPLYDEANKLNIEEFKEKIDVLNNYVNGYFLTFKGLKVNSLTEVSSIHSVLVEKTLTLSNKLLLSDSNVPRETLEFIVVKNINEETFAKTITNSTLSGFGILCPRLDLKGNKGLKVTHSSLLLPIAIYKNIDYLTKDTIKTKNLIKLKEALRPYFIKTVNDINKGGLFCLNGEMYGVDNENKLYINGLIEIDTDENTVRIKKDNAWIDFTENKEENT